MPRPAAAIFGFALVAFSIGFNTMRYPVVWDMVGPATEGETDLAKVQKEAATETAEQAVPAPTVNSMTPGSAPHCENGICSLGMGGDAGNGPTVAMDAAEGPAMDSAAQGSRPSLDEKAIAETAASTESERPAPLAPVAQFPPSNMPTHDLPNGPSISRLPPIDQVSPNPYTRAVVQSPQDGAIRIYPSTGY